MSAGQMSIPQYAKPQPVAIPRPQVGIDRLPARRQSNEPRELMNCKSCRKRKIKCNRLRPACEACQVFQCPCVYDATPKKRGPKGDVLEALLRRVDGLEAKLKEKNADDGSSISPTETEQTDRKTSNSTSIAMDGQPSSKRQALTVNITPQGTQTTQPLAPLSARAREHSQSLVQVDLHLDTYFTRLHGKPYHILDESFVRQRMELNQMPNHLSCAISAVASRYTPHPSGYQAAVKLSEEYATLARSQIDTDDPSMDTLQTTLLLVMAYTAAGKGKKAYMLMVTAIGIAMALELHREVETDARQTPVEKEMRRRLFWTCYLLDRFHACGSRRPALISDKAIMLRLPSWSPNLSSPPIEGDYFQSTPFQQQFQGVGRRNQGSTGMLVDITRILGTTNIYLAAGGVKGDSHFPWHSLSRLSKIRQDLDVWLAGTDNVFQDVRLLCNQVDSTISILSKLIYHLIHCIIYRPFLPIDLAELAVNGQHQSWQIEATNLCFLHANSISELIDLVKQTGTIEWPAFVGYCICTAATVHIHGMHYSRQDYGNQMNSFSASAEFLSKEMQQLSELRFAWASVQHQRETLQRIYHAHGELVQSLASKTIHHKPGFQFEDFFSRYVNIGGPGGRSYTFDAANLSLLDMEIDFTADAYDGDDLFAPRVAGVTTRPNLKRKTSTSSHPEIGDTGIHGGKARPLHPRSYSMIQRASSSAMMPGLNGTDRRGHMAYETLDTPTQDFDPFHGQSSFDPMFGNLSTNAFNSPSAWQAEAQNLQGSGQYSHLQHNLSGNLSQQVGGSTTSPGNVSSTGTHGEEKDPFMSLLEQMAENEYRIGGGTSHSGDLDFLDAL